MGWSINTVFGQCYIDSTNGLTSGSLSQPYMLTLYKSSSRLDNTINLGSIMRAVKEYKATTSLLVGTVNGILTIDLSRELFSCIFKYRNKIYTTGGSAYLGVGMVLPLSLSDLPKDFFALTQMLRHVCITR
jgi:hypothetical protein